MKISTRVSIILSLVATLILILFGGAIYFFSERHSKNEFSESLKQRVLVTENFFLEKEFFSESEFEKIRSQFLNPLPKETEEVIELNVGSPPVFQNSYPDELKNILLVNNNHSFQTDRVQGESKQFTVNGARFLIIVTAEDEIGRQNIAFLLSKMLLLILIGIPIIFIVCFIITNRALQPLAKKIDHANKIGVKNLDQRLNIINPNDEIGQMAIAFNKLLDRLEKSFEAQKSFISNASHEIRSPLTAIMGEAEVALNRDRPVSEYKESLIVILSESERLNLTVNNLLQLSKVIANEDAVQYEVIEIDDFMFEVIESYSFVNPLNRLVLCIELKTGIGKSILGNKNLLKTALINIFDNACKFSLNDIVDIRLKQEGNVILLTISDQGIGVPKGDIEKIREPFYRAKNTLSIKGSGIGLALSSKIVELHNGNLEIYSEEGEGTKIGITVPYLTN